MLYFLILTKMLSAPWMSVLSDAAASTEEQTEQIHK